MRHGDTFYWNPPERRGPGAACAGPTYEARDDLGGVVLGQGSQKMWVPIEFLRAVVEDADRRKPAEPEQGSRARVR